jgi:hypothetical protein
LVPFSIWQPITSTTPLSSEAAKSENEELRTHLSFLTRLTARWRTSSPSSPSWGIAAMGGANTAIPMVSPFLKLRRRCAHGHQQSGQIGVVTMTSFLASPCQSRLAATSS